MRLASKQGATLWEMAMNIANELSLSYSAGFFNMPYDLITWTDGFTFPPKEVVLRIFIVINPSLSAGFEPASLGSSVKHNNHYTTENDMCLLMYVFIYYLFL
jgi:hypothetical protein